MNTSKGLVFLLVSVVLTVAMYLLPNSYSIRYPFLLLSTLAHEMGHGIAAVLVGGHFSSFKMYADGSGVAYTSHNPGLASALVSAGGLVGPAIVGAIFFAFANRAKMLFFVLGVMLVIAEIMVVRNTFGLAFVGGCALLSLLISVKGSMSIQNISAYFVANQLALSVFSRGDYLFKKTAQTEQGAMPSDVAHMADALFLPYWFWGGVCGLFSLLCLFIGLRAAFRNLRNPTLS